MRLLIYKFDNNEKFSWNSPPENVQVYHQHGDVENLLAQYKSVEPNLILLVCPNFLDFSIKSAIAEIKQLNPSVVFLTYLAGLDAQNILEAMRLGVRDVIFENNLNDLNSIIKKIFLELRSEEATGNPVNKNKKIGFVSAKGGDGSSSLMANFATLLSTAVDNKILLVDLSIPFGDIDIYLTKKRSDNDLASFINELQRMDATLLDSMIDKVTDRLHFMSSPNLLEKIIGLDPDDVIDLIEKIELDYDHVLIDLGSSINPVILKMLSELDQICLVFGDSLQSARKAGQYIDLIASLGIDMNKVLIYLNKKDKDTEIKISDYERVIHHQIAQVFPLDNQGMRQAVMQSRPYVQLESKSSYTKLVQDMVNKFLNIDNSDSKNSIWQILKRK